MLSEFSYLEEIGHEKGDLIKGLQLIQQKEGYVSDDAVRAVAENFGMSPAEVEGVLTFYAQFKRVKPGRFQISSCDGTACHIKGSPLIQQWITAELGIKDGETDKEGRFSPPDRRLPRLLQSRPRHGHQRPRVRQAGPQKSRQNPE